MGDPVDQLPEAAERRLASGAFASGLTIPDFAACLELGLQPVGLVQGFCVMQWGWYSAGSGYARGGSPYSFGRTERGVYNENFRCPHGFVSMEHRTWGQNYEQPWVEQAWAEGFGAAFTRMLDEAREVGAHGVVGVVDRAETLADLGVTEFHLVGTAVTVDGGAPPPGGAPWSTYLAGQRLAKLVESGFMPVSVTAALVSVRVWAYCMTEYLMEGRGALGWGAISSPTEITQISHAHGAARRLVRDRLRHQLAGDSLQGATLAVSHRELSAGDEVVEATLRGTRVRRVRQADPLPVPRPTVRLT
jgi:hypothetical protein